MDKVYKVDNLYLGMVEHFQKGKRVTNAHVLVKSVYDGEMLDLNLCKMINEEMSDDDEIYFERTLIPFNEVSHSRINWGSVSREDALKLGYYMYDRYLKFLRIKRVPLVRSMKK